MKMTRDGRWNIHDYKNRNDMRVERSAAGMATSYKNTPGLLWLAETF